MQISGPINKVLSGHSPPIFIGMVSVAALSSHGRVGTETVRLGKSVICHATPSQGMFARPSTWQECSTLCLVESLSSVCCVDRQRETWS